MTTLFLPSHDDRGPFYHQCPTAKYRLDQHVEPTRRMFSNLPLEDLVCLFEIPASELDQYVRQQRNELCDVLLDLFDYEWKWAETGEAVDIDTDFCQMFLGQDVTYRTVRKRLREQRHYSYEELHNMISFFKEGDLQPVNH